MTLYIALTAGLIIGGILLGLVGVLLFDEYDLLGFLLVICAVLLVLCGVGEGILVPGMQAYGHSDCNGYSRNTGRQTKFVTTTSIDTGTCMTKDAHGRWIAVNDLRAVAPQQP